MEGLFGHMLFTESKGHFPQLRQVRRTPAPPTPSKQLAETTAQLPTPAPTAPNSAVAKNKSQLDAVAPPPLTSDAPPIASVPTPPKRPDAPLTTVAGRIADEVEAPAIKRLPTDEAPPAEPAIEPIPDSEMRASAKRLLNIDTGFNPEKLAAHLISTADIDVSPENSNGSNVKALYSWLESSERTFSASGTPQAGDLVFFSNTYDRDEDERPDDWFTMVGVVEKIDSDGTVQFIGWTNGRVQRLWMNLDLPSAERNESLSKTLNSQLRAKSITDRPFTRYFAGELFAAYGRP